MLSAFRTLSTKDALWLHYPPSLSSEPFVLTRQQEAHARQMLHACEQLARQRYRLCPRLMKENEFWRVYFCLLSSIVHHPDTQITCSCGEVHEHQIQPETDDQLVEEFIACHQETPEQQEQREEAIALAVQCQQSPSMEANDTSSSHDTAPPPYPPAAHVQPSPVRTTLNRDAIDRWCGVNNLHKRNSTVKQRMHCTKKQRGFIHTSN